MTKFLVGIEFRYIAYDAGLERLALKCKTVTVGVFDSDEDAIRAGDAALEEFEKRFELNPNYNAKLRFGKHYMRRLITDLGYIETPFSFSARITELRYEDVGDTIDSILVEIAEAKEIKESEAEEED